MEPVAFKTLFKLLESGLTVGQLATAIEEVGIHGWDRFGRYDKYPRASNVAKEALDGLADFYTEELTFWQQLEDAPPQSQEEYEWALGSNPIDAVRDRPWLEIHRLGWPEDQVPVMPDAKASRQPRRAPQREPVPDSASLYVLGALLKCLAELRSKGAVMTMPSEDVLNGKMTNAFPKVKWISRTTIHNCFVDAKKAVEKAQHTA